VKLTLSLAQIEIVQADAAANLKKAEDLVAEAARRKSDIICFPEMWTTGFNWEFNRTNASSHEVYIEKVADLARRHGIWINGSMLALNDEGKVANTSILFNPQGEKAAIYRKTHLFSLLHEERHMMPGSALTIAETPWGPMGLSICYDIRFPEIFRTYALKGARVTLSPMAFPHPRLDHWKILVRARAIENQMYMVGINRVGNEDMGAGGIISYFGTSCIIDPWGKTVVEASECDEMLLTATIDLSYADEVRKQMTVLSDRRPELYDLS
jgi:omega-amidase